ncbi:MAG: hypothetical protein AAFW47_05430, partial [Pseudomonadota bacterium]
LDPNVNGDPRGDNVWAFSLDLEGVSKIDLTAEDLYRGDTPTRNNQSDFNLQKISFTPTGNDEPPQNDIVFFAANSESDAIFFDETILNGDTVGDEDGNLSIVASVEGPDVVESVVFDLDGIFMQTENFVPFAVFGDNTATGNLFQEGLLTPGEHTLTARAFSDDDGAGDLIAEETITFVVVDEDLAIF